MPSALVWCSRSTDDTKSKKIKPVIEKLQEKNLVSSVFWSHKIGDYVFLFGRDGILYKVNKNLDGIEEQITIKEKKEDDAEKSEYVVVWKTQNPDEILLQNHGLRHPYADRGRYSATPSKRNTVPPDTAVPGIGAAVFFCADGLSASASGLEGAVCAKCP